ncbi:MAG: S-methyl-5-thioribose-1-phosphate isomerase, partial [Alphaproteobacteria bacterium]|nr:S-methyl-5-thioribose-1-phosphate isomerase [Alphaproteobacteria bacterium]
MNIDGKPYRTIWREPGGDGVQIIDQTRLPHELVIVTLRNVEDVARAIRDMLVRGAPLIGGTAAYGMAIAAAADASDGSLAAARE